MKGFARMTGETGKFYRIALVLVIVLFLSNTFYLCGDDNLSYGHKILNYDMTADSAEQFIEKNAGIFAGGKSLSGIISDKLENLDVLGFWMTLIIFIGILLLKQFAFMDKRTAEFQMTLPVKKQVRVWHDYLYPVGIMLIGMGLQTVVMLIYQTNYNMKLKTAAAKFSIEGVREDIVSVANGQLLSYMGYYILYCMMVFTLIYFGMLLMKNHVLGVILAVLFPTAFRMFFNMIFGTVFRFAYADTYDPARNAAYPFVNFMDDFECWLERIFMPLGMDWSWNYFEESYIGKDVLSVGVILVVLLAGIAFIGGRRELSKGKLFYFPILDYPFAALSGVVIMFLLQEVIFWEFNLGYLGLYGFSVAIMVIIFLKIHPLTSKKTKRLEVK